MPFTGHMGELRWRRLDTRVCRWTPLGDVLGSDSRKARRWLSAIEHAALAHRNDGYLELTDPGAFWIHLVQNHFALAYVNTLWTAARREPWPSAVTM